MNESPLISFHRLVGGMIICTLILIGLSTLLGFGFNRPNRNTRDILTYRSTHRYTVAAMMIAMSSFALIPTVLIAVVIYSLLQIIFVIAIAFFFEKQKLIGVVDGQ